MSSKLKVLIIDDEKLAINVVKGYLENHDDVQLVGECRNGFDGMKAIAELNPDLVFLDIQMPKINGFEMLEIIDNPPIIIFTTAFDQYALKAFEVNATDYLLKPFSQERFDEAFNKAKELINNKSASVEKVQKLEKYNDENVEELERIVVKQGSKIVLVGVKDIKYLEAQDDYVQINSSKGKFLKQKTMKFFEENLPSKDFIRIHRSYIAKISEIKQIELLEKESYIVKLQDDSSLPVSKSGYAKLKEILH